MADIYQPLVTGPDVSPKASTRYRDISQTDPYGNKIYLPEVYLNNPGSGGGGGTGGPTTIADGADVAEGSTTDAAVTAGSTGTISGKLRTISNDISGIKTSVASIDGDIGLQADAAAAADNSTASLIALTKKGNQNTTLITTKLTDGSARIQGMVASGTTDSGNPIKIGGVYNATQPTLTTGQRGDIQLDTKGNQRAVLMTYDGVTPLGRATDTGGAALIGNANTQVVASIPYLYSTIGQYQRVEVIQSYSATGSGTQAVSLAANTSANAAPTLYRNTALTNTGISIKASAGNVYGWNIINQNTSNGACYVKLYDKATAASSTDTPILTISVPAGGVVFLEFNGNAQRYFATGLSIRACTGLADSDNTAPAAVLQTEILYK